MALRIRYDLLVSCILVLPSSLALADQDPVVSANVRGSTQSTALGTGPTKLPSPVPGEPVDDKVACIPEVSETSSRQVAGSASEAAKVADDSESEDEDACGSAKFGALGGIGGPDTAGAATGSPGSVQSGSGSVAQALPTSGGRGGPRTQRAAVLSNFQWGFTVTPSRSRQPSCFLPGTRILTPSGERNIEDLKIGDVVSTQAGAQPIKFIPKQVFHKADGEPWDIGTAPVRVHEGALGDGLPNRDLLVSPQHALYLDGLFVAAGQLLNGSTIVQDHTDRCLEYLTIELEGHALIWANGVLVETYRPTSILAREAFDNFADYVERYPGEEYRSFPAYTTHRKGGLIAQLDAAIRNRAYAA